MSNTAEVINLFEQESLEIQSEPMQVEVGYVKADLDEGYTRLANTLFEALASNPAKLNGREYQVFCAVILKTYRYHKKSDWIAQSQLVEMTGIGKTHISAAIKSLVGKRVLTKTGKTIAINTVISQWQKLPKRGTKVTGFGATIRKKLLHKNTNNITCALTPVSTPKKTKSARIKKPQAFKDFFSLYPAHRRGGSDAQAWKVWKSEKLCAEPKLEHCAE
jgi:phage replication O-like protein O